MLCVVFADDGATAANHEKDHAGAITFCLIGFLLVPAGCPLVPAAAAMTLLLELDSHYLTALHCRCIWCNPQHMDIWHHCLCRKMLIGVRTPRNGLDNLAGFQVSMDVLYIHIAVLLW
jgi:hypothetical protein